MTGVFESVGSENSGSVEKAIRALDEAERGGTALRLLGGVAVYLRCASAKKEPFRRSYTDVDFIGHARQSGEIKRVFAALGYVPRERFNAMHGSRRLGFVDPRDESRIDVFLDVFEMCHRLDLRERMEMDPQTITLADLLATKLQVIETNEKDFGDMFCLLLDHEVAATDREDMVNGAYLGRLCGEDWGIYKTFTMKLAVLGAVLDKWALDEVQSNVILERIGKLEEAIEKSPKGIRWKMRSVIGERLRWYELPEEDIGGWRR